ncbi:MAG: deoxyribose-phosphate aldolase [Ilumatobacteraceae bacterium]
MDHDPVALARRALALLDLTELGDQATDDDVTALCGKAHGPHGNTAAVCVWPRHVAHAVDLLWGTNVRIATVVNFPSGAEPIDDVVGMTTQALADGADEIDLVIPYHAVLSGDLDAAAATIDAVRDVVPQDSHLLKVILETGELRAPEAVLAAATLAVEHGADFIKTSTGKTPQSATPEATAIMLSAIRDAGRPVGLKPSGGIRTLDDARIYLDQADEMMGPDWATPATFRFGASGLLTALISEIEGERGATSSEAY